LKKLVAILLYLSFSMFFFPILFTSFLVSSQSDSDGVGPSPTYEVHITPNCALGYGYLPGRGDCSASLAIKQDVPMCTEDSQLSDHCVVKTNGHWTSYLTKTTKATETKELLDTMITAEGAGWGASASVSVDYMTRSTQTENSVSFYVGQNGDAYSLKYQTPTQLKLNEWAADTLKSNWQQFIMSYGTHFVSQVTHGSTFIGHVSVTQTASDSASTLNTVATFSADASSGVFSAKGSAKLKSEVEKSSSSLKVDVSKWHNGRVMPVPDDGMKSPAEMLWTDYQTWLKNVEANPEANTAATKMVYRSWASLEAVQAILRTNWASEYDEVMAAFAVELPTQQTMQEVTKEYLWAEAQLNTVNTISGYPCVKSTSDKDVVALIRDLLTAHIVEIQSLSVGDLLEIQSQIKNADFSWFLARSDKYVDALDDMRKACAAPLLIKSIDFDFLGRECPQGPGMIKPAGKGSSTNFAVKDKEYSCLSYTTTTDYHKAAAGLVAKMYSYSDLNSRSDELGWTKGVPKWNQIKAGYFTEENKAELGTCYGVTSFSDTGNTADLYTVLRVPGDEDTEKFVRADSMTLYRTTTETDPELPSNRKPLLSSLDVKLFDDVTSAKDSYVPEAKTGFSGADLNKGWKYNDFAYVDRGLSTLYYGQALTKIEVIVAKAPQYGLGADYSVTSDDYRYIRGFAEAGEDPIIYDSVVLKSFDNSGTGFKKDFSHCTGDLNAGREGRWLYICYNTDDKNRYRDYCTGDLNKKRGGDYLHLCYNYWTVGSLNPDVELPTTCSIRFGDDRRRSTPLELPAPVSDDQSLGLEGSQLIQRLLRSGSDRRRAIRDCGKSNCYFGFPGFTSQGYPHIHANKDGLWVTFEIPSVVNNREIRKPQHVEIVTNEVTRRGTRFVESDSWEGDLEDRLWEKDNVKLCNNGFKTCSWKTFVTGDLKKKFKLVKAASGYQGESSDGDGHVDWTFADGRAISGWKMKFGMPSEDAWPEMLMEIERVRDWWFTWINKGKKC